MPRLKPLLQQIIDYYWRDGGRFRGSLHGIIDDGNLENITLDVTIADFERALVLMKSLRSRPYKARWIAYVAFWRDYQKTADARILASLNQGGD